MFLYTSENSYKEPCAYALVSLSDFQHLWIYKSHILNRTIAKLYISAIKLFYHMTPRLG